MDKKKRVAILFGGRSGEHEVSLQSAASVIANIDRRHYEPVLVAIEKSGRWVQLEEPDFLEFPDDPARIRLRPGGRPVTIFPDPNQPGLQVLTPNSESGSFIPLDVVFPVLHGTYAEDGTIQGLLELAGLAFVASGVTGSATAMDKILSKRIFRDCGLSVLPFIAVHTSGWAENGIDGLDAAELTTLGLPLFVKPVNLGSSVGVNRVDSLDQLAPAIEAALRYDTRVLVEKGVDQAREIELAVLGNEAPRSSIAGEIIPRHTFYSYEAKYLDPDGAELLIPAQIDDDTLSTLQQQALAAFAALDCAGMARVDFLLDPEDNSVYLNEVNTIPGFTSISMYPKLWAASGLPYSQLIGRLIELALERQARRASLETNFTAS